MSPPTGYARLVFLAFVFAAAVACGVDERTAAPSGTNDAVSRSVDGAAAPAGAVPEGVLLVQKEASSPPPVYGITAAGEIRQYERGFTYYDSPGGTSPDGTSVSMWLARADGSSGFAGAAMNDADGTQVLYDGEWEADAGYPQFLWSPDGSHLAYTIPEHWPSGQSHVFLAARDGSDKLQLTSKPGYYFIAGWAADGRLFVTEGAGVLLLGPGEPQKLPFPDGMPNANRDIQLSPDGRNVAIQLVDYDNNIQELWLLEIDTLELRILSRTDGAVRRPAPGLYVSSVPPANASTQPARLLLKGPPPMAWSPDSTSIAYHKSYRDANQVFRSGLWLMDVGSSEETLVTDHSTWWEDWSPDGRHLAFAQEPGELALFGPDRQIRELDIPARQALWSRSGRLVAATAGKVTLIDPDSSAVQIARTADGEDVAGSGTADGVWSPSGRYLAFKTPGDQYYSSALYVLDVEAATVTLILDKGSFRPVGWIADAG